MALEIRCPGEVQGNVPCCKFDDAPFYANGTKADVEGVNMESLASCEVVAKGIFASLKEGFSRLTTSAQERCDGLKNWAKEYVQSIQNSERYQSIVESDFVTSSTKFVEDNRMPLGYGASSVGGFMAADAGVKLLRNDPNTSKTREVVKLCTGAAMVAGSLNYAADVEDTNEKNALIIAALSGVVVNTAWKAVTNPIINRIFVLKTHTA